MLRTIVITLPMLTCVFWLVTFLIDWSRSYGAKRMMAFFYLAAAVLYACHFVYFSDVRSPWWETLYAVSNLMVYPLFLFYLIRLSGCQVTHSWWVALPAGVVAVAYPVCFIAGWSDVQQSFYFFARICFMLQVLVVWFYGHQRIKKLVSCLDDYFTDDRSSSLQIFQVLLWVFGGIAIFSSVWNVIGREAFDDSPWLLFPALLMSLLLYVLGYVAYNLPDPLVGMHHEPVVHEEKLTKEDRVEIFTKVDYMIREQKLFREPNLTIQDLASKVGTNRTYLSSTINQLCGVNFSTYINRFRIEEAKTILANKDYENDKNAISTAIALSGFATEQTFYRVFKEHTQMTPLQYRSSVLNR